MNGTYMGLLAAYAAALAGGDTYMGEPRSRVDHESPKLGGFTEVRGRRRLSKKRRKELKKRGRP